MPRLSFVNLRSMRRVDFFTWAGGTRLRWNGLPSIEERLLQDAAERKQSKLSIAGLPNVGKESSGGNETFVGTAAAVTQSVEFTANFSDECLRQDGYFHVHSWLAVKEDSVFIRTFKKVFCGSLSHGNPQ